MAKNLNKEEVIKRMQELEPSYDFSKFEYINSKIKSTIICDKGHEYNASWDKFREGNRCPLCNPIGKRKIKHEEIIKRMQELEPEYDFSKFIYNGSMKKSIIICDKGHEYECSYSNFYHYNSRCDKCCTSGISKNELEIIEYLNKRGIKTIQSYKCINNPLKHDIRRTIRKLEIDIYLPQLNIGIEYNGKGHNKYSIKQKLNGYFKTINEYHQYKTEQCYLMGIELIHIDEDYYIKNKDKVLYELFNKCIKNKNIYIL